MPSSTSAIYLSIYVCLVYSVHVEQGEECPLVHLPERAKEEEDRGPHQQSNWSYRKVGESGSLLRNKLSKMNIGLGETEFRCELYSL